MARNLKTVAAFAADMPFTEGSLRWMIFNAKSNGLADSGAIVRVGRRVYIDPTAFDRWIDAQQPGQDAAGGAK